MLKQVLMVEDFQRAMRQYISTKPTVDVPQDVLDLRFKLIEEELKEVKKAVEEKDLVNLAKEYSDLLYVVYGGIINHGLTHIIEDAFQLVQNSNMSKLDDNGNPIFREDGKVMKGPNYKAPDLTVLFKEVS